MTILPFLKLNPTLDRNNNSYLQSDQGLEQDSYYSTVASAKNIGNP